MKNKRIAVKLIVIDAWTNSGEVKSSGTEVTVYRMVDKDVKWSGVRKYRNIKPSSLARLTSLATSKRVEKSMYFCSTHVCVKLINPKVSF